MIDRAAFALAHPVFDPERQITARHTTKFDALTSVALTVNIGME